MPRPHGVDRFTHPEGISRYLRCNEEDSYDAYIKLARIFQTYGQYDRILDLKGDIITYPRGNVDAKIMVVGQNPGGKSVIHYPIIWTNSPLSKWFMAVIEEAGIFDQCWFTNVVPWPTYNNRITTKDIEKSSLIFAKEVKTIRPSVIIALGGNTRNAIAHVLGPNNKIPIKTVYHPSFVKRFRSKDSEFMEGYVNGFRDSIKLISEGI